MWLDNSPEGGCRRLRFLLQSACGMIFSMVLNFLHVEDTGMIRFVTQATRHWRTRAGWIRQLRQETFSEQSNGTNENWRCPYFVLQGFADGRHCAVCRPLDRIKKMLDDFAAGVRFQELWVSLAERPPSRPHSPRTRRPVKNTTGGKPRVLPKDRSAHEDGRATIWRQQARRN